MFEGGVAPTSDPGKYTVDSRSRGPRRDAAAGAISAGLRDQYSALADDSQSASEKREAAVLLSVAGGHIDREEDLDEALRAGKEALEIFRKLGDGRAVADALRVVVDALRLKAVHEHLKPDDAIKTANDALTKFKAEGDKRGQASMLLALARVGMARPGSKHRDAALRQAKQASALATQASDRPLEGASMLALAEVHTRRRRAKEAVKDGQKALDIFKELEDKRGQARAQHCLGSAQALAREPDLAQQSLNQAAALSRELGDRQVEAAALLALADLHVEQESPREALAAAREALAAAEEVKPGSGTHLDAVAAVVRAYQADKDPHGAIKFAQKVVKGFQESKNSSAEAAALELQALAHLEASELQEAESRADDAVSAARQADDRQREAAALCIVARIQFERQEWAGSLSALRDVFSLYRELADPVGEARAQHIAVDVHAKREKWEEAMAAAKEARELFAKAAERHHEARALLVISVLHWVQEQETEAMNAAREAQFIFQRENDQPWEANALHHISEMYAWTWNCSPALKAVDRAVQLLEGTEDRKSLASVMSTKGVLRLMVLVLQTLEKQDAKDKSKLDPLRGSDEVMADIEKAKVECEKAGNKKLAMYNLFHMAEVHFINRRTGEAMTAIQQGEEMNKEEDKHAKVVALILQGYILLADGYPSKAEEKVAQAKEVAESNPDKQNAEYGQTLATDLQSTIERQVAGGEVAKPAAGESQVAEGGEGGPAVDPEMLKMKIVDVALSLMGMDNLAADTPLMDAGLDSLSMVEFRNELVKEFPGVDLPGALLFDYPTVNALTDFIAEGITNKG